MINIHIIPNEIGVALSPHGNPIVTGLDKTAGVMISIEVDSAYWKAFLENAGRLKNATGILPATTEDIVKVAHERNGL